MCSVASSSESLVNSVDPYYSHKVLPSDSRLGISPSIESMKVAGLLRPHQVLPKFLAGYFQLISEGDVVGQMIRTSGLQHSHNVPY